MGVVLGSMSWSCNWGIILVAALISHHLSSSLILCQGRMSVFASGGERARHVHEPIPPKLSLIRLMDGLPGGHQYSSDRRSLWSTIQGRQVGSKLSPLLSFRWTFMRRTMTQKRLGMVACLSRQTLQHSLHSTTFHSTSFDSLSPSATRLRQTLPNTR